jgi:hypothetical protein
MKIQTAKRFVFGLLSSLLFAVGFAHAADRLDPMSLGMSAPVTHSDDPPTDPCDIGGNDGER